MKRAAIGPSSYRSATPTLACYYSATLTRNPTAVDICLIGAVLLEHNDRWRLQHCYIQIAGMAALANPPIEEPQPLQITLKVASPWRPVTATEFTPYQLM